ncbi:EF-hand domain-containing protein [Isosphaeraceae bacterium EP7]
MRLKTWALVTGLGLAATVGIARAEDTPGPIDSLQDLQESGRILFKTADANNDGQISQKEAIDAANLMVGGFFFRADANGDGVLSQEEAKQARESFLAQKPLLRVVLERTGAANNAKPGQAPAGGTAGNPLAMAGSLLDSNNDKQLQATEVRQAIQTAVQGLYATADTNRDGQMSPTEVNAAMIGAARAVAQASFQAADTDNNGQISVAEYEKAIVEPSKAVFKALDANNDGQISAEEAKAAQQVVINQVRNLRVPEPQNSAKNLIESGRRPEEVAPVPNLAVPAPAPR